MIVHDSFSVTCFPRKSAGSFELAAISSSLGSAASSEFLFIFKMIIHDKEHIEDRDNIEKRSSKESVNSQELEETPPKKNRITKR